MNKNENKRTKCEIETNPAKCVGKNKAKNKTKNETKNKESKGQPRCEADKQIISSREFVAKLTGVKHAYKLNSGGLGE